VGDRRLLEVRPDDAGSRVDVFLARHLPGVSRTQVQELIRAGGVSVGGVVVRPAQRLLPGETVAVALEAPEDAGPAAVLAEVALGLLYVDQAMVVVNKAAGVVVHAGSGHRGDTLADALVARFPELAAVEEGDRPGLVHRLDRDTSGVMVVARTAAAAAALRAQFKARSVVKVYLALVKGEVRPPEGVIDAPVGRDPRRRQRMTALASGRPARTAYRLLGEAGGYSFLEARPQTGRTHQIRVHLAAIGHPVAGDPVYGRRDPLVSRTALHAWRLEVDHPVTAERMRFEAPLPADMAAALARLGIRREARDSRESRE
jgi:23S rRNA pseudouridine1911/1915/1917 synthase